MNPGMRPGVHTGDRHVVPLVVVHGATAPVVGDGVVLATGAAVIGERTRGCLCCQARLDVVDAVRGAVERAAPPERIVVHVGAEADVATVVRTVLSDPDLVRLVDIHGVVAHVDGRRLVTRAAVGLPLLDEVGVAAVSLSDAIVIERREALTAVALADLEHRLRVVSPFAAGEWGIDPVATLVNGSSRWHGAPHLVTAVPTAGGVERPALVVCRADRPLDPDGVDEWMQGVVARHASRLLRLQGALAVAGRGTRVCCRGVRSHVDHHDEERPGHVRSHESMVALLGVGLDAEEISAGFLAART